MSPDEEVPFPEYLSPIVDQLTATYTFVREIASGKTGTTYRIASRSAGHHYCLKTVSPSLRVADDRERVRRTLRKEVAILQPLSHRCLPRVYENNLDGALPYYICTFHPGSTLEEFRREQKQLKLEEAIFVIASLLDVLEYIHERGRTHCDLHPENILLSDRVFAEGLMIIDFGSGHRGSASDESTPDRGHLAFKDVVGQARHQRAVRRNEAMAEFQENDIRAFGRTLAVMERSFFSSASHDQLLSYRDFCRQLQQGTLSEWSRIREKLDHVVDPESFQSKAHRLFVMKDGSHRSITLPASDGVPVGEAVLAVVNCQVFQRLRTIKQLSFCEWFFPGGTHTRFEHSLGVFGVARRALGLLARDSAFKEAFTQSNFDGALLAGLVHDVGHYPFAHVIEHYVAGRFAGDQDTKHAIHHFDHTLSLLDTDVELQEAISRYWGEDLKDEAKRILQGRIPLSQILDGPVDCDKLDYLRRDAHHCGVPYGEGLDTLGVLSSFRFLPDSKDMVIDSSRIHAVEGFVVVQDQMLAVVYWHETIRAVFAMFHRFLDGALQGKPSRIIDVVEQLKRCSSEHEALQKVFLPLLQSLPARGSPSDRGSREELKGLIQLHVKPSFESIFRPIAKYAALDPVDPRHPPTAGNVFESIVSLPGSGGTSMPIRWNLVKRLRSCYSEAFREKGATVGRFDVLVDVPWGKASNRVVNAIDSDSASTRPITEISHLPDSIFSDPTAYSAPVRVYIAPELFRTHESVLGSIRASAEERYFGSAPFGDDEI